MFLRDSVLLDNQLNSQRSQMKHLVPHRAATAGTRAKLAEVGAHVPLQCQLPHQIMSIRMMIQAFRKASVLYRAILNLPLTHLFPQHPEMLASKIIRERGGGEALEITAPEVQQYVSADLFLAVTAQACCIAKVDRHLFLSDPVTRWHSQSVSSVLGQEPEFANNFINQGS